MPGYRQPKLEQEDEAERRLFDLVLLNSPKMRGKVARSRVGKYLERARQKRREEIEKFVRDAVEKPDKDN